MSVSFIKPRPHNAAFAELTDAFQRHAKRNHWSKQSKYIIFLNYNSLQEISDRFEGGENGRFKLVSHVEDKEREMKLRRRNETRPHLKEIINRLSTIFTIF